MANKIAIFYSVFVNPRVSWKRIVSRQIDDFRLSGVLSESDLYIVATNHMSEPDVISFLQNKAPESTRIIEFKENAFEFRAIYQLWRICDSTSQYDYVAYCHTKGMSYARPWRNQVERTLTLGTFMLWKEVIAVFEADSQIHICALLPSSSRTGHFAWYNFWWARTSYIKTVSKPEKLGSRHYYEKWLALTELHSSQAYSISMGRVHAHTDQEAITLMQNLSSIAKRRTRIQHAIWFFWPSNTQ